MAILFGNTVTAQHAEAWVATLQRTDSEKIGLT